MRVLILDDDRDFLNNILPGVEKEFVADVAYSNEDGEYLCSINDYDSYVVSNKHFEQSAQIKNYPNVLVLADIDSSRQKVKFLNSGADVVMDKAADADEISAQIKALMRKKGAAGSLLKLSKYPVTLDLEKKLLQVNGVPVSLRKKEFQILEYFFLNKNKIVCECELLEHIWKDGLCVMSNTVAVHIRNVRKLILQAGGPNLIETIKNLGYVVKDV